MREKIVGQRLANSAGRVLFVIFVSVNFVSVGVAVLVSGVLARVAEDGTAYMPAIHADRQTRVEPYADAPACPTHDDRAHHGIWDEESGCHYDHSHGDDPHSVDHIFGADFYNWAGGEISYPWETPGENEMKHGAYNWFVRVEDDCFSQFADGCIRAFRAQAHGVGAVQGDVVAFHSAWLEALVCSEAQPDECGIIRGGGWQGPADLMIDYLKVLDREESVNRHFISYFHTGDAHFTTWYNSVRSNFIDVTMQFEDRWNAAPPGEGCAVVSGQVECAVLYSTEQQLLDATVWFCDEDGDGVPEPEDCPFNSSRRQIHLVGATFPGRYHDRLDPDGDGVSTFSGFTDRYGELVAGCTEVGLDCVPFRLESYDGSPGVPVDVSYQRRGDSREYDLCFYEDGSVAPVDECNRRHTEWSGWFSFPLGY